MDDKFDYKGYVCEIYHFTCRGEIFGYGAALYKDGERLLVANHGWNLIQSYSIESVKEECMKYIDKL